MTATLLGRISEDLLLQKDQLEYLIRSAPHRYKVYQVPKRSGSGMRTIAQPAKEVKIIQYWVIDNVFPSLAIHPSATAYVAGKNIHNNSEPHVASPYLLKLDFKDFFPSIIGEDFLSCAQDNRLQFDPDELQKLVRILFWCPKRQSLLRLSIGAPTSPFLSNAIMYRFDAEITEFCSKQGITYTRYADDMTFSMREKSFRGKVLEKVLEVLSNIPFPKLKINDRKTVFGSKAHRRMVTGLILSNDEKVSLGRERKRRIRAQIHYFITGRLLDPERKKLKGMLAFARDIEPKFVESMEKKYSQEIILSI